LLGFIPFYCISWHLVAQHATTVEVSARGNGIVMAQDVNSALMLKLPVEFKSVGIGVHKAFDDLAENIDGKDVKIILREIDSIMDSCIGYHLTYKLELER